MRETQALAVLATSLVFLAGCAGLGPTEPTNGSPFEASSDASSGPAGTTKTTKMNSSTASPSPTPSATTSTSNASSSPSPTNTSKPATTNASSNQTHVHAAQVKFDPKSLNITKGGNVTWHGHEAGHTVTIHKNGDPFVTTVYDKPLPNGGNLTYQFESAGLFHVYCKTHSNGELGDYSVGMTSTVNVK